MIPSNFIRKCAHRLTYCAACDRIPRNNKHLLTESWSCCINREEEMQSRASSGLNGASARLFGLLSNYKHKADVTQTRTDLLQTVLWAGKRTAELLPPTQTSSLEHGGDGLPTAGWTDMKKSFHMTLLGSSTTDTLLFLRWRMIYCSNYFNSLL